MFSADGTVLKSYPPCDVGYLTRYSTSYDNWDRKFSNHYNEYTEKTDDPGCCWNTCFPGYSPPTEIYVQETIIEKGKYSGYSRITVFENSSYEKPYVSYYIHNARIVRCYFNQGHPSIFDDYYSSFTFSVFDYEELNGVVDAIIKGEKSQLQMLVEAN